MASVPNVPEQHQITRPIRVNVEWNELGGYSASSDELHVYTFADTLEELQAHIVDALNLLFEPENRVVTLQDVELIFDLQSFFAHSVISSKAVAKRAGINPTLLSKYATGKRKASAELVQRIADAIHAIGRELQIVRLA